jgi:3-deoxy-D-manno-octulosonic-acid transferase
MRFFTSLCLYRLTLPLLFVAAFPGWVIKMLRRGGFGTQLGERAAIYTQEVEFEPCGCVHFHAVSVGESMLALKLIREWQLDEPERSFILATGTATGHAVASAAKIPGLRVTYAPLDFPSMVKRYLNRFEPSQIVLVEGEVWPHLLLECQKRNIPVRLVNARMSPRSKRRFTKFAKWLQPIYQLLDIVAIQDADDAGIWQTLGISPKKIHCTGSLKFDSASGTSPKRQPEFQARLDGFGKNRPVILAASTHAKEDAFIAKAIYQAAPHALIVLVPRHAERRAEVKADLENAGFFVELRSSPTTQIPRQNPRTVLVIDSTGELRDWTAHANVVVIGKSFFSIGGQNPCEAILAGIPVIFGPHMENFQPLAEHLALSGGGLMASNSASLSQSILTALNPQNASLMAHHASAQLALHRGATRRILKFLQF